MSPMPRRSKGGGRPSRRKPVDTSAYHKMMAKVCDHPADERAWTTRGRICRLCLTVLPASRESGEKA